MAERPIIFSGPMVRAILDGRKTQTRRVVKPQPPDSVAGLYCDGNSEWFSTAFYDVRRRCPFGRTGDRLWVRETLAEYDGRWFYDADQSPVECVPPYSHSGTCCPSIHMPRWASRITLEITGIRVEQVQAVSEEDARAEGVIPAPHEMADYSSPCRAEYRELWDSLNAKRGYGWDVNPLVFVIEFKRVVG